MHRLWENCINPWLPSILIQIENRREAKYIWRTHIRSPSTNGNSSLFFYLHSCSLFSFHFVAFGLFSLFERICYLHCAHHIAKKQSTGKEKQNQERMFIFIRKNQQMFFIDVLMNIKWVFIEINTIECVRRAICLLRLFKYILTRTSAILVAACTTFEFFFSSHSAQQRMLLCVFNIDVLKLCLTFDWRRREINNREPVHVK